MKVNSVFKVPFANNNRKNNKNQYKKYKCPNCGKILTEKNIIKISDDIDSDTQELIKQKLKEKNIELGIV